MTVTQLQLIGNRHVLLLPHQAIQAGIFQLFAADDRVLFDSGAVAIPAPGGDVSVTVPTATGVRRVRFSDTADGASGNVGFAELKVIGSALVRREPVLAEKNLVQLLPTTALASSSLAFNVAENAIDGNVGTNWYGTSPGDFLEIVFPLDVTVSEVRVANPGALPDGFSSTNTINCAGTFTLIGASGTVLFDSGPVVTPSGNINNGVTFTLPVPSVSAARRLRYTSADCTGSFTPPGFSEIRVFGSVALTTTTAGLQPCPEVPGADRSSGALHDNCRQPDRRQRRRQRSTRSISRTSSCPSKPAVTSSPARSKC